MSTETAPRERFWNGSESPVLAALAEPPTGSEDTAWHEGGHAVVAHAFGAAHQRIELDGQASVIGTDPLSGVAAIAMLLAGPAAQRAYSRAVGTLQEAELDEFFERVDAAQFGGCDECRAALHATASADLDGRDRREVFREGEARANEMVARPNIRAAIAALATELVDRRSILGTDAREIIDAFVPFGRTAHA
ncbi:hypothetical protein JP75_11545 [Devosia riboflavina]|uniref:Peptidase M41 domain-containing protein n=1 Tax=Devosia riboflavina TaxID=46914 RepID=A0A087M277_9HYPH|nr:hypothetical protein [Devosia riboflavina]KFL30980.1 hypothetical protein JP75_11545 [Devosia riboflavina]